MDVDAQIESAAQYLDDGQLRSFACECALRLLRVFNDQILRELISFGQVRCVRRMLPAEIKAMYNRSGPYYDVLYPGYGNPSPLTCAIDAGGSVSFTESALMCALDTSASVAIAVAQTAADKASDAQYQSVYKSVLEAEEKCQMQIPRKYLPSDRPLKRDGGSQ